jgi:uncharacterized damage-inducible protein DinB
MQENYGSNFLKFSLEMSKRLKSSVDTAVAQVDDEEFFTQIAPKTLSIAHLMKHMSGNIKSRWTNFFTEDGEKPWRHRDREFIIEDETKEAILKNWKMAWDLFFSVLEPMKEADLARIVQIRWTDHTVMDVIYRHLSHIAQHSGQIIFLAKHLKREAWQTLSIPLGKSEEFNERIRKERLGT